MQTKYGMLEIIILNSSRFWVSCIQMLFYNFRHKNIITNNRIYQCENLGGLLEALKINSLFKCKSAFTLLFIRMVWLLGINNDLIYNILYIQAEVFNSLKITISVCFSHLYFSNFWPVASPFLYKSLMSIHSISDVLCRSYG